MTIKEKIIPDYENTGHLYSIEVSTDSKEEFDTIKYFIQLMKAEIDRRNRKRIKGDSSLWN